MLSTYLLYCDTFSICHTLETVTLRCCRLTASFPAPTFLLFHVAVTSCETAWRSLAFTGTNRPPVSTTSFKLLLWRVQWAGAVTSGLLENACRYAWRLCVRLICSKSRVRSENVCSSFWMARCCRITCGLSPLSSTVLFARSKRIQNSGDYDLHERMQIQQVGICPYNRAENVRWPRRMLSRWACRWMDARPLHYAFCKTRPA